MLTIPVQQFLCENLCFPPCLISCSHQVAIKNRVKFLQHKNSRNLQTAIETYEKLWKDDVIIETSNGTKISTVQIKTHF